MTKNTLVVGGQYLTEADELPVRCVCADLKPRKGETCLCLIDWGNREEPHTYTERGQYWSHGAPSSLNLKDIPEKRKVYVVVGQVQADDSFFSTHKEAVWDQEQCGGTIKEVEYEV